MILKIIFTFWVYTCLLYSHNIGCQHVVSGVDMSHPISCYISAGTSAILQGSAPSPLVNNVLKQWGCNKSICKILMWGFNVVWYWQNIVNVVRSKCNVPIILTTEWWLMSTTTAPSPPQYTCSPCLIDLWQGPLWSLTLLGRKYKNILNFANVNSE